MCWDQSENEEKMGLGQVKRRGGGTRKGKKKKMNRGGGSGLERKSKKTRWTRRVSTKGRLVNRVGIRTNPRKRGGLV